MAMEMCKQRLARGLWMLTPPVGMFAALAGEDRAQEVFAEFKKHEEAYKALEQRAPHPSAEALIYKRHLMKCGRTSSWPVAWQRRTTA